MYWTTLSLFMATESFFYPIISWMPFYSWIRFGTHLYLVMPGQQGSVYLYQTYIHPFLAHHEREIDSGIAQGHERAKQAGLQYLKQAIEWTRVNLLGLQPKRPTPPVSRNASYTSSLLSRFNMPSAREGLATAAGASDIFALLGNAIQQASYPGSSRSVQAEDLAASGSLVPPHLTGAEKTEFISTQRDRLRTLLQAFEREDVASTPELTPPLTSSAFPRIPSDMLKSRSETDFEDLTYEEVPPVAKRASPVRQASWSKWVWGNYGEKDSAALAKKDE